jgi:integrase
LIGLYTGTRASAIAAASPYATTGHSHVDLEQGIFYRLAIGRRATKKRQPPVPIPGRLLAHMTRWCDRGIAKTHFVEWNGKGVASIRKAFKHAVELAELEGAVTPHTLRHTAATWLMQRGVDLWQAAGFLGMSVETLERNYGHHHPNYMQEAARAIGYGHGKRVSLAESLAERNSSALKSRKTV